MKPRTASRLAPGIPGAASGSLDPDPTCAGTSLPWLSPARAAAYATALVVCVLVTATAVAVPVAHRAASGPLAATAGPRGAVATAGPASVPLDGQSGQDEPQRREERVVVTAQRVPGPLDQVGSSVTVVTAEEIEASGARWLTDVLAAVPGVTVVRTGGPGAQASVFLRGTASNHTLFLVNGVEMNSPTTGAYDLTHLPASRIERVEVVRGPQGSLYGSQALGGVINVITRSGGGPLRGGVEVDGGSFGTGGAQAWVEGGGGGSLGWSAGVDYSDTDGISAAAREGGNSETDGYDNVGFDARFDWTGGSGLAVDGFVRAFDARTEIDDFAVGVGPVDDGNSTSDAREVYGGLSVRYAADGWSTRATLSDSELDLESVNPDGSFSRAFRLDASIREIDWQVEADLPAGQSLVGGVEYQRESGAVQNVTIFGTSGYEESVDVLGIYLDDRLYLGDRVLITVGGRHEEHDTFGGHTTFRTTGTLAVAEGWRVHGSVGSGFRAPSLNDLFFPGFGNPDLAPEESLGADLGVGGAWAGADVRADVTGFWNDIDNLVAFGPTGPVNLGRVTTRGVELIVDWSPVRTVDVGGSYTFTDAVDEATGLQLVRRPRHQGGVSLTVRPTDSVTLNTRVQTVGQRPDSGAVGRVMLDGYGLWNAAATWTLTPSVRVRGRVENILDDTYQQTFGFGTPGVSAYGGLVLLLGDG